MKMNKLWVLLVLVVILCFCGCSAGIYELNNSPETIAKIELYSNASEPGTYAHQENVTFIRQLEEDEIASFVQEICNLEMIMTHPPAYGYGSYIAVITYSNGDMDILSNHAIEYVPAGEQPGQVSGDTFPGDSFEVVFLKYADINKAKDGSLS